ncbi:SAM-dependent methyltransferase [bacterium]|nr:SAM-dependent methyltransferase [bacterium]
MKLHLPVDHVSDTAYLVALLRSYESERPDAKFRDPFAALLAEPKTAVLESKLSWKESGTWLMTARTHLLDRHIERLARQGSVQAVVNLAAGLDTRAYRLSLPENLAWIEADFPELLDYKKARLSHQLPKCSLQNVGIDLGDDEERHQFFARLAQRQGKVLVLTEGLLPYLPEESVITLAAELRNLPSASYWLMDVATPALIRSFHDQMPNSEPSQGVAFKFGPAEGPAYFERLGWRIEAFDSFVDHSECLERPVPSVLRGSPGALNLSGIALLSKRSS